MVSDKLRTALAKKIGGEISAEDYVVLAGSKEEFRAEIRPLVRLQESAASLHASEQHYRRLLEILPESVVVTDAQGRLFTPA
jgi:hypothetical protein